MENNLIGKIIKEKTPCYFVSPHFDDAALSAGGLMAHLAKSGVPITVATIFTKSDEPATLSAKKFLRLSGFDGDAASLFRARTEEDMKAFSILGIKPVHLGFVDALWRKIPSPNLAQKILGRLLPEFVHVYPIYRLLVASNKISPRDRETKKEITSVLSGLAGTGNRFFVFCPLGLSSHVDHILTRDACLMAFGERVILWSDFPDNLENPSGAFAVSPERGRYVHVVALAEKGDFALTRDWADVAYPDVGVAGGKFYSFFAPGVTYFAVPFYLIGANFNLAQVAVFFMEIIIGAISAAFIYKIARNIFALSAPASFFSVLVFAFASSAWNYSITLYQHLFTVLFMTTAFYAAWKFRNESGPYSRLYASWVWAAYALSIFIGYPTAAIMLPIMLYFAYSTFSVKKLEEGVAISIKWAAIATVIVFVLAMSFQFWHNAHYYGSWLQLVGGIAGYQKEIPINMESPEQTQDIGAFFSERNIPKGFYVLLFSDERGLFFFYPIFILSLFGTRLFWKKSRDIGIRAEYILALSLIFVNLALYSSWGDPWGGWAYGPRYLIPSMAVLSLFIGGWVSINKSPAINIVKKILAYILFLYSSGIALLGAITTNAIPP